tara:strand:+ start:1281 stop:1526 length:246 start_codon:yes stop_codon:yes gene_type:complete
MSLSKKRIQDKIEIVGEFKTIQIRYQDQIIENGKVLSQATHRESIECDNIEKAKENNVEELAKVVWTSDVKKSYKDYKARM